SEKTRSEIVLGSSQGREGRHRITRLGAPVRPVGLKARIVGAQERVAGQFAGEGGGDGGLAMFAPLEYLGGIGGKGRIVRVGVEGEAGVGSGIFMGAVDQCLRWQGFQAR